MAPGLPEILIVFMALVVVFLLLCGGRSARSTTKQRWLVNSLLLILVGPLVALLIFGIGCVFDPPNPLDTLYMLSAFLLVGLVASAMAACAYTVAVFLIVMANR